MAEFKDIIEANNYEKYLDTVANLGPTLSRAEIEAVLVENGYALPLPASVRFYIHDSLGKIFLVSYGSVIDKFSYTLLAESS